MPPVVAGRRGPAKRPTTLRARRAHAEEIARRLTLEFPDAVCELHHRNAFELLAATILSAQCTDARVNLVTPVLFARYPSPADLAAADQGELEEIIRPTGFFRNKSKSLIGMAAAVLDRFGGEVPGPMEDLVTVPGVGRKTANVVRSVALGLSGLPVDTHVLRLSSRLGLTAETDPVRVETDLGALLEPGDWGRFSLRVILHGRRVCSARKPSCGVCTLADICPSVGTG